jgi:hypothetical protein
VGIDGQRLGIAVVVIGLLIAGCGAFYAIGGRLPFGQLPGDISGGSDNVRWSVPLGSALVISIVLSVVLTVVLNLVIRR